MEKEKYLLKVEEELAKMPKDKQEKAKELVSKIEEFVDLFPKGEFYCKRVKQKDEDTKEKTDVFTVGIKERTLSFVRLTLNLETDEITWVHSVLQEDNSQEKVITDPLGNTMKWKTYEPPFTIQDKKTL